MSRSFTSEGDGRNSKWRHENISFKPNFIVKQEIIGGGVKAERRWKWLGIRRMEPE
jgi:hypothetical protein